MMHVRVDPRMVPATPRRNVNRAAETMPEPALEDLASVAQVT